MASFSLNHSKQFTVNLVVGPEEKVFKIDAKLLMRSDYLYELFKSHPKTDVISLSVPKASTSEMQLYMDFLYLGPYKITLSEKTPKIISDRYTELATVFKLAKSLKDTGTQNDIALAMLNLHKVKADDGVNYPPSGQAVRMIYNNTTAPDPMRKMMVDLWIPINKSWFQSCGNLPDEFLRDVLRAMAEPTMLDSKGLRNAVVAVMDAEQVKNLSNRAQRIGASAYMR